MAEAVTEYQIDGRRYYGPSPKTSLNHCTFNRFTTHKKPKRTPITRKIFNPITACSRTEYFFGRSRSSKMRQGRRRIVVLGVSPLI